MSVVARRLKAVGRRGILGRMIVSPRIGVAALMLLALLGAGCRTAPQPAPANTEATSVGASATTPAEAESGTTQVPSEAGPLGSLVEEMAAAEWLAEAGGIARLVSIGLVNQTGRCFDAGGFNRELERLLVEQEGIEVIAGPRVRELIRAERMDQQTQASEESVARLGEELGAEYALFATVAPMRAGQGTRAIQLALTLIEIETNRTVWIGTRRLPRQAPARR